VGDGIFRRLEGLDFVAGLNSIIERDMAIKGRLIDAQTTLNIGSKSALDASKATKGRVCRQRFRVEQFIQLTRGESKLVVAFDNEILRLSRVRSESLFSTNFGERTRKPS